MGYSARAYTLQAYVVGPTAIIRLEVSIMYVDDTLDELS